VSSVRAVARGTAWAAVDSWAQQGIQLITFLVIGNIVGPGVYGTMAVGIAYYLIASGIVRDSFSEAVIQRLDAEPAHFDTALVTVIGIGVGLSLLSLGLAPLMAHGFGVPELRIVISILGLVFPVMAAANLLQSVLRRGLNFRALAIRSLIANNLAAILAMTLAYANAGIWSLLVYQITLPVLDLLCLIVQSPVRPRLRFSLAHFRDLVGFSGHTIVTNLLNTLGLQIDRLLIGYFIGTHALGLYGMARRIVESADKALLGVVNMVALPVFTRLQATPRTLAAAVTNATRYSTLIAYPAYAGLALVVPKLVDVALTPEWRPIAGIVQVLCAVGLVFPLALFLATGKRAVGRVDLNLRITTLMLVLRAGLCLGAVLLGYGMAGILIATCMVPFLAMPYRLRLSRDTMEIDRLAYLSTAIQPLAATLIMAACVFTIGRALAGTFAPAVQLTAMIVTGIASYVAALLLIARASLREALGTFTQ